MKKVTLVKTTHHVDTHVEVTFVSALPAGKVTIVMKVSHIPKYYITIYTCITNRVYLFAGAEDDNSLFFSFKIATYIF